MSRQQAQQGFTLVEVMVALFIVAVALPALMFQLGTQLDSTASLRDKTLATWVAEDQVAMLRLAAASGQVVTNAEQGDAMMAGRAWRWQLTSETTPLPGMNRVTVEVFDAFTSSTGQSALVSLTVYTLDKPALVAP